eukprot:scaffold9550_cov111-Isochrysis_galbana.AAC.2
MGALPPRRAHRLGSDAHQHEAIHLVERRRPPLKGQQLRLALRLKGLLFVFSWERAARGFAEAAVLARHLG